MVCNVITADKANKLYWLGRYAERVYITLHLLRRYYDKVIDGDISDLTEYYTLLGVDCSGYTQENEALQLSQLYDRDNICSIITSLDMCKDNAIVLRRDITSESLSYIQMSHALIEECSESGEKNITRLQLITDYMLALFGSIDERVFDKRIRRFIKIGKLIENLDLHIRFNYPFFRIEEAYTTLREHLDQESTVVNHDALEILDDLIVADRYDSHELSLKGRVIEQLNKLISI
ncbi:MAG: alpha-E domain-containing protein [Rikenellaceae bacterium]